MNAGGTVIAHTAVASPCWSTASIGYSAYPRADEIRTTRPRPVAAQATAANETSPTKPTKGRNGQPQSTKPA